jgi:hypothetical protein
MTRSERTDTQSQPMSDQRITVIHDRSEEAAEANSYLQTNSLDVISVSFGGTEPEIPMVVGDWYWIVIGSDSTMYEFHDKKIGRGAVAYKFRR